MNNSWTEIIKDINVTTWIFIREYLKQLNQIPECDRTSEQKLIYRQYDKYDDIIINLSDDDIQKLSFSSACSFEIAENSCNECLKYLNDNSIIFFSSDICYNSDIQTTLYLYKKTSKCHYIFEEH